MRTQPPLTPDELLRESDAVPEPGYEEWARAKIEQALIEARDPDLMIPAEEVWRELGLET
jgi:hypothetical protein